MIFHFRKVATWAVSLLLLATFSPAEPRTEPVASLEDADRAQEIHAKVWFNAQPVRLFEPTKAVLIEFWSVGSAESHRLIKTLNRLQNRYLDGRLLVVGLTSDERRRVEVFLRRRQVQYKVGAESDSAASYGVKEFPSLFLVDLKLQRVLWRAEGPAIEGKDIDAVVAAFLGSPEGSDRSARRAVEEETDRSLTLSRGAASERALEETVDTVLALRPPEDLLQPEDLWPIDDFYERQLPSDTLGADAASDRFARSLAISGGYGKLDATERLSEEARLDVEERLLSILGDDPDPSVRLFAAATLGRKVGRQNESGLLQSLRELHEREPNAAVQGRIQEAVDRISPHTPAEVRERLEKPNAQMLWRQMADSTDPVSSRWGDAYAYQQTVRAKALPELLGDYWASAESGTDVQQENAAVKRLSAVLEINRRRVSLSEAERNQVQGDFLRMLSSEPDSYIRRNAVLGLWELAKEPGGKRRREITQSLERHLPVEADPYLVTPTIKLLLDDLKSKP
jgi:hypothetical protein